jgi:hypothetical protein
MALNSSLFNIDELWESHAAATILAALCSNPQAPAARGAYRCVDMNDVQFLSEIVKN